MTRYFRQTLLPDWGEEGQTRLRQSSVLCVGMGGLGSPVALYLAAAGVGRIGLVDADRVDLTNLQRQVLYRESDIGHSKVEAAARALRDLNSEVAIECYPESFHSKNAQEIAQSFDLILDGTDQFSAKFLINDLACRTGKPWVYGSVNRFEGQVALFSGRTGPCYRCLVPERPQARVQNCAEAGVIGAAVGVVGSSQALLALQWLVAGGDSNPALAPIPGQLTVLDMRGGLLSRTVKIKKRSACTACSVEPHSVALEDWGAGCDRGDDLECTAQELALKPHGLAQRHWVDVRELEELQEFRDARALHLPLTSLEAGVLPVALPRDGDIILYCKSGLRSREAARILRQAGWLKAKSLAGGYVNLSRRS